jgi:hypothetical protein|tara:strand:- start:3000 stop:3209 length:210 start_codon:yes stop_codon:yes gene_type:complete
MATEKYEKTKAAMAKAAKKSDSETVATVQSMSDEDKKKALAEKKGEITQAEMDEKAANLAKIMRSKKDK